MHVQENVSLASYTTFGFETQARYFVEVSSVAQIQEIIREEYVQGKPLLVLGGGSNLLFTTDHLQKIVLRLVSKGIQVVNEDEEAYYIEVQAGEIWDDFVQFCVDNQYGGVENLSLIPGTVGASPMQNIGAYGVEIQQVFHSLLAVERSSGQLRTFMKEECHFGYRESIFKTSLKDQYIIASVTFKLPKNHIVSVEYGDIKQILSDMGIDTPTMKDVREAVIKIRTSKLPNPAILGNAGSFFKNPIVPTSLYYELKQKYPTLPGYVTNDPASTKVAAGWLIEQAGWKGYREGNVGVHERQALVLVHFGNGKGQEVLSLCKKVQRSVREKFGIELTPEVNIVS